MSKFTAGPWKVVADERYDRFAEADRIVGYDIKSADGEIVGSEGISGDSEINLANARLIAAAPDLLEALENLLGAYSKPDQRMCCSGTDCGCMGATIYDQAEHYARSAIARAIGEA